MPQPIIQSNCISSQASYRLEASYLKWFMDKIYDYEPGIGRIIEEMCGVFKRQEIKPIITAILDHYMTFIPTTQVGYAHWGNSRMIRGCRVGGPGGFNNGIYVGHGVNNDLVGMHTDIMVGQRERLRSYPLTINRDDELAEVCQHWGLVWQSGSENANTSMNIIKSMLNNQVEGECCIIFSMINPRYHDNMYLSHSKQLVEIVMPRHTINTDIISNNDIINATEKNYSKVYRGLFVESLRRHLNIQRPMMMSDEQERYLNPVPGVFATTMHATFDRYYDNYLTQAPHSIRLLTQT